MILFVTSERISIEVADELLVANFICPQGEQNHVCPSTCISCILVYLFPVLCHQCGSLFSGDGASDCVDFDPKESSTQKRCAAGEACLWYAWEKSKVGKPEKGSSF